MSREGSPPPLGWRVIAVALVGYVFLTLLMTYPLVLHTGDAVVDHGDPLLNAWIMAWEARWLTSGAAPSFFDANMFYPYENTLAYSELLLTQSMVALPVQLATGNPIQSYNVIVLLAFVTSAMGTFLLATHLTGQPLAGALAGTMFAFSPFMFDHLSHVQVLSAGGIPMTFLFLHHYVRTRKTSMLVASAAFYTLQVFANGYYALYLTLFAGSFLVYDVVSNRRWTDRRMWLQYGLIAVVLVLVMAPVLVPYTSAQNAIGLERPIGARATLSSYLTTSAHNRLYGDLTSSRQRPEANLFPGIVMTFLAAVGLWQFARTRHEPAAEGRWPRLIDAAMVILVAYIALMTLTPVAAFGEGGMIAAVALLGALALVRGLVRPPMDSAHALRFLGFYVCLLIAAFLFSFGSDGPYVVLHRYVPGFDGLRAVSRIAVLVMLALAVLASVGAAELFRRAGGARRSALALGLGVVICFELASFPIPSRSTPVGDEIPEVYQWLASLDERVSLVEYPIEPTWETASLRSYYSTYHWHDRVNGYSGYFPPLFLALRRLSPRFPSDALVRVLEVIGVHYVIVDSEWYGTDWAETEQKLRRYEHRLERVKSFATHHVYRIRIDDREQLRAMEAAFDRKALPIANVSANTNERLSSLMIDGDLASRWEGGPQAPGQEVVVDLGEERAFGAIILSLGEFRWDYPRALRVEGSVDGESWDAVWSGATESHSILGRWVDSSETPLVLVTEGGSARWLKLRLEGSARLYWSIAELKVAAAGQ